MNSMVSNGRETPLPWHALRVRSNSESLADQALRGKGYETFAPCRRVRRRWSDRIREIALPLFPGYVFCRLDACRRTPVLQSPGVVEIVGVGNSPSPIDEREIEAVRAMVASGADTEVCNFLRVGNRVRIGAGPLEGAEGIIATIDGHRTFVVSISLLQRSVSVRMNEAWLWLAE